MNATLSEYLTAQFYAWEQRGRGWTVFKNPVHLEPEFIPFFGHIMPAASGAPDDGRRARFFPELQQMLGLSGKNAAPSYDEAFDQLGDLYPVTAFTYDGTDDLVELQINFDIHASIPFENIAQLLLMLSSSDAIIGFELFGTAEKIVIQFVCPDTEQGKLTAYIESYAPGVVIRPCYDNLYSALVPGENMAVIDLGLSDEFMRPLRVWNRFDPDPLLGCIAVLESLKSGEFGMLQVLFQSARNPWHAGILNAVMDNSGGAFFANDPDMLPLAQEKTARPLFATVVRAVGQSSHTDGATAIARQMAESLISYHRTGSNTLIPLSDKGYDMDDHIDDMLDRKSRRTGMLLNCDELASMVHIPDASVASPKLRQYAGKTKAAPKDLSGHAFELGRNEHLGQETTVTLPESARLRHQYCIGATGTGKSSLLQKMITQDIAQGKGITVLDPHGDLIDAVMTHIPDHRLSDVVLVDPSDSEYSIGLNLLSATTDAEKIILSSDLVALFRRFATSWGDQMTSVLANAINAILESSRGGTLIDLRRFLVESKFRDSFLKTIDDPSVVYYWKHEFKLLRKNTVAPILTRLDTFLRPRIVRNMMAQKEGLNCKEILNGNKILLVKLAQGLIGEDNSYLLGTLIVAKIHQAAQSRQNIPPEQRQPSYFYIDEFQHFITPSMSAILSGSRKYGLGLILAHQDLEQLSAKDSELANSVLSNPAIRVCFRCGDRDAAKLENGFAYFDATDLQNLGTGQAIARVGQKDHDFNLSFDLLPKVDGLTADAKRKIIVDFTRQRYSKDRTLIEAEIKESLSGLEAAEAPEEPVKKKSQPEPAPEPVQEQKPSPPPEATEPEAQQPEKQSPSIEQASKEFIAKEQQKEELREHRYLQEYIKKIAEQRGFKTTLEEPTPDGGKVDVGLLFNDIKIACEISVTNTVDYELQNIQKCLRAGYGMVFMISNNRQHLQAIREKAAREIEDKWHSKLFFVNKDEFVQHLNTYIIQQEKPQEQRIKGYRVKLNYTGEGNTPQQKKALKDVVLGAVRRKE